MAYHGLRGEGRLTQSTKTDSRSIVSHDLLIPQAMLPLRIPLSLWLTPKVVKRFI